MPDLNRQPAPSPKAHKSGMQPLDPEIGKKLAADIKKVAPQLGLRTSKNLPIKQIREALSALTPVAIEANRGILADASSVLMMAKGELMSDRPLSAEELGEYQVNIRNVLVKVRRALGLNLIEPSKRAPQAELSNVHQ